MAEVVEEAADDGAASVSFAEDETSTTTTLAFSHTDLFAAVEESILSCRPLVNFFYHPESNGDANHDNLTVRQRRDAICDIVRSPKFNKARARRLFAGLNPLLTKVSEEESYVPDEDDAGDIIQDSEAASTQSIQFLKCSAVLVEAYLEGILKKQSKNGRSGDQKIDVIDEAFEVAEMLHDLLFPLQEPISRGVKEATQTQSAIFGMCEKWWHGNFEDREQMVTQLIPLLLVKSLDDSAQKNDVKRLYSIREAIDLLDFEDDSILTLKMHLLRTVGNPLFLQSVEGRKFITHLFQVDASLIVDLHRAVRAQIVGAKKSILNAYADIYYSAWKAATDREDGDDDDEIQKSIEENALQDFMYQVIHGAKTSTVKSVRVVLDKFYVNKKTPAVEGMLHRMYGPLLWRALSSANSKIRVQASVVLTDTFPLRDPEASEEWTEAIVEKSVGALISLMKDDVPNVRVAGSKATAKILSLFWAAVPSKDIRALLNHIIAKHASDASSSAVRAAAVNAVTTLLEEDKTHAVLRPLLPSLGNLIHDKTEKVRLAVVNMLLFVKKVRGMKYYHVVPANHLLVRLGDEGRGRNNPRGPVASSLSNLLSNSFFPTGSKKTLLDIINRTLRLLTDSPEAAVTFYRNASSLLPVNSISKLIAALMKCLCFFLIKEKRMNCEDVTNLSLVVPEDESIECKAGHSDTALMATIAESISILWESIESDLKDAENEHAEEMIMQVFTGNVLTDVYCHFESKLDDENLDDAKSTDCFRACVAILNCAGKVDESKIEGLRTHIVGELSKAMPVEKRMKPNFSPNVALLCAWGMTGDVAQCLASSIQLYFEGGADDELNASFTRRSGPSRKRKQRGKKKADADGKLPKLDIDVCLDILGHILKGSNSASVSARESILQSETAFSAIASALQTAKAAAERMMKPQIASDSKLTATMIRNLGISIECLGRLLIHREAMNGEIPIKLTPELKTLMTWVTDTIVPYLVKLVSKDNTLRDLDLSSIMGSPISSPVSAGHSQKIGRNSSIGDLGDSSFISQRGSINVFEDRATFTSTRAAAIATTTSILYTFAEWLSIRVVGDLFVSEHISKLCNVLECSDTTVRKALLPLLFHVAIICLKNEGDSALLKEVLLSMRSVNPSPTEEEIISHYMTAVMSFRDERISKAAISTVVHVTRTTIVEAEEEEDASAIDTSFIDKIGVCLTKVLKGVLSEKRSSLLLAQCLIGEPKTSSVRESLFKELDVHSPKTDALQYLLNKWAAEKSTKDTDALADEDKENTNANLHPGPMPA